LMTDLLYRYNCLKNALEMTVYAGPVPF